jgi:peptide/nickel transport system permease protein
MATPVVPEITAVDGPGETTAPITRRRLVFRRFLRNRPALVGIVVLVVMFVGAFVLPHFIPFTYEELDAYALNSPPTTRHWFGTNQIGQDVVADVLLVVPSFLVIAICSPLFRDKSFFILVLLLAAFAWMITSRIIRAMTRSLREREFIRAAKYMGATPASVIGKHVLPSMASILIVDVTLNVGIAIIGEASLSYFGFGVQRPDVSLGTLIADGTSSALTYPWLFAFCCGALVLIVLATNFVGDGLRDAFDPNSTRGQARG